jgi:predicted transposase YbfD/YdcC
MDADLSRGPLGCFESLEDPRMDRTKRHELSDIIAITLLATLAGAEGWVQVALYGQTNRDWLKTFLKLHNGIPAHDTFGRVFGLLDPDAFEKCLLNWITSLVTVSDCGLLHIDGKSLRRSFDDAGKKTAVHMVSVWASKVQCALAQVAARNKDKNANEITTIPQVLDLIVLSGAVVTIDAIGCQKAIAQKIVDEGGHYVLAVKDNQKQLHADVKLLFDEAIARNFDGMGYDHHRQEIEADHGRIETRQVWITRDVDWLRERGEWPGLRSVVCVESTRQVPGKAPATQRRYYITDLDHRERGRDAAFFAQVIRSHWSIENQLHWHLDVSFDEDGCRVRQGYAAENLSRIRRTALNLLKQETSLKVGIATKRLRAAWDRDYLLKVIGLG